MYNVCIHHVDCHFYNMYLYSCAKRDECSLSLMLSCSVGCPIASRITMYVAGKVNASSCACGRIIRTYPASGPLYIKRQGVYNWDSSKVCKAATGRRSAQLAMPAFHCCFKNWAVGSDDFVPWAFATIVIRGTLWVPASYIWRTGMHSIATAQRTAN